MKSRYPLLCPESELSGGEEIESGSLKALADGEKEERWETPLVVGPDDKRGKHWKRRDIPLVRVQTLREEGKVVPKHECPILISILASMGLGGPGELHLELQQTTVDDFSLADSTRSSKHRGVFYFEGDIGVYLETTRKVAACQELVRLPISWQQRGVIEPSNEENK